ncbi:MAG TPA: PRC-barrel domain-containing protein [Gemmatimonadaceae bacterium]|jgi:hypothetical protein
MPHTDSNKTTRAAPEQSRQSTLYRLAHLPQYAIVPGQPDIRSWLVFAEDGRRVGRVSDVIVDILTLRMRHIEVELDPHWESGSALRRVVVPLVCARVSANRKHINLYAVTSNDIVQAPRLGSAPIGPEAEAALERFFVRPSLRTRLSEVAEADVSQEQRFWGARRSEPASEPYLRVVECD